MACRKDILEEMNEAFASNGQDPNLTSIIVGARGTGKTARTQKSAKVTFCFAQIAGKMLHRTKKYKEVSVKGVT
jgi:hypothetical protein